MAVQRKRHVMLEPRDERVVGRPLDEQGVLNAALAIEERAGFLARPSQWW